MIDTEKLHTTELGKVRIARNLNLEVDVMKWVREAVAKANQDPQRISRKGKNWYIRGDNYIITINFKSNTVITAHKS